MSSTRRMGGTRHLGTARLISVTLVATAPDLAPEAPLYLASNVNGWNPSDPRYQLAPGADGKRTRTISLRRGEAFEFKLSRGGWERVEVDAAGKDIPNRKLRASEDQVLEIAVAGWRDAFPQKVPHSTLSGDVRTLGRVPIATLRRDREVLVYLPPGYDAPANAARRYPVLYLFDGQNLFDSATAFSGEWGIDKTLDRLIPKGRLAPLIVVAIYNGREHRIAEQSPWPVEFLGLKEGEADRFLDWVVGTVKPQVDTKFRTLTGREDTGIGGSSMGGLTALYATYSHPETFGKALVMSPALWIADRAIFPYVRGREKPAGTKIYLDCGHLEGVRRATRAFARTAGDMAKVLQGQGFHPGDDFLWVDDPIGSHDEASWGRRLPDALRFLWPPPPRTTARRRATALFSPKINPDDTEG